MTRRARWLLTAAIVAVLGSAATLVAVRDGTGDRPEADRVSPRRQAQAPPAGAGDRERPAGRQKSSARDTERDDPAPPRGDRVARLVAQRLGPAARSGERRVIESSCRGGRCVVRYRSETRGRGAVLASQTHVLRTLFRNTSVDTVELYVHHQKVGSPRKDERPAFAAAVCDRSAHAGVRWSSVSSAQVERLCTVRHVAGGRLRNLVRRGELSLDDAKQARDR